MASYEIGKLIWKIEGDTSGIDQSLKKTESGFSKVINVAKNFLGVGIVAGFVGIAKSALSASAAMEKNKVAFTTMLGSAAKATQLLKEMSDFAASTPFELTEIVTAGKSLLAFGTASKDIIPTLTRLGDVAAALNIPIGELSDLYGKARVQGTLYAEDLNQMAGRGIPIFTELAKVMNVNAGSVKKLGSEGKISFALLEQAFKNMTAEGSQFGGLMEAQAQTLGGKWSNFQDVLGRTAVMLGDEMAPAAKDVLDIMTLLFSKFSSGNAPDSITMTGSIIKDIKAMLDGTKDKIDGISDSMGDLGDEMIDDINAYEATSEGVSMNMDKILKKYGDVNGAAGLYTQYTSGQIKLTDAQVERLQKILALSKTISEQNDSFGRKNATDFVNKIAAMGGATVTADGKPAKPVSTGGGKGGESEATKLRRETFEKNTMYDKLESEKLQIELDHRIGLYQKYKLNSKKDVDDLAEYKKNAEKEITKAQEKELRERLEKYNAYSQAIGGSITNLLSAFQSYFNARGQADIEALDAQMQAELEAAGVAEETQAEQAQREYDAAVATGDALAIEEKRRALVKAQIEEKYQKKKRQLEYETALTAWKLQVGMSLIQSFQAPLNAYVSALAIPVIGNFIAPGLAAAAGIAAGAMFAATLESKPQPPKYASGGIIPGSAQGTQIIAGDGGTELVSNADQMANILNAIGNGASTGGGYRQVPPMSRDDLFTMIFEASQNGDLFVAERALVKR